MNKQLILAFILDFILAFVFFRFVKKEKTKTINNVNNHLKIEAAWFNIRKIFFIFRASDRVFLRQRR
jgi:hypothetical protein